MNVGTATTARHALVTALQLATVVACFMLFWGVYDCTSRQLVDGPWDPQWTLMPAVQMYCAILYGLRVIWLGRQEHQS